MIKTELVYNPYLLETDIKFNGQAPHINSLVEKYQDGRLQDWIKELPEIFHDEMNGYDFELEFSGTPRDFSELQRAFKQAGVSEKEVRLFHKNELEERDAKRQRIKDLLSWLETNPNRNFDNEQFRLDNAVVFDGAYSVISVQREEAGQPVIDWAPVSIEIIKNVSELDNTDLTFTPIVISVDSEVLSELQGIIKYLRRRSDVVVQQIFFRLDENLNNDNVYRIIRDLGIRRPHFIDDFNDEKLKKYLELYPITEYIVDSIEMFRGKASEVETILEEEKAQGEQSNSEIEEKIQTIDSEINKIRTADEEITARNNIDKPTAFTTASNMLASTISGWRKKKTKTVEPEEASALAEELYLVTARAYKDFSALIKDSVSELKSSIDHAYQSAYASSGCDDDYVPENISFELESLETMPKFDDELMRIQTEEKVRNAGIGLFAIPVKNQEDEYFTQVAFYMQPWRERVYDLIEPLASRFMNNCINALAEYNSLLATAYHEHLLQIIVEKIREEEHLANQLSSEAKQIQQDSSWLTDFKQQLKAIERG